MFDIIFLITTHNTKYTSESLLLLLLLLSSDVIDIVSVVQDAYAIRLSFRTILMVCSLFCCPAFRFRERVGVPQKHPRKAFRSDGRRKAHKSANGAERETIAHAEVRDNDYNNERMRMRKTLTTAVQQSN